MTGVPDGFLNICKASGFTSHDVVAVARRLIGVRRIGHAGTLDPAAEGVLPLCVGRATRLVDRLADADKGYYAEIVLGVRTRTDDAEGEVVAAAPPPALNAAGLDTALDAFRGPLLQRPPAFSAVKVAGRRAYDLARRGDEPGLQPRPVIVHRLSLDWWRPPRLGVTIGCSKGTYIRALARDLGDALGCGAHLARLVRLWVGQFRLAGAISLDELAASVREARLNETLMPVEDALLDLPAAIVGSERSADMRHGRAWRLDDRPGAPTDGGPARVYDTGGTFLGLVAADRARGMWQPRLSFVDQPSAGAGLAVPCPSARA